MCKNCASNAIPIRFMRRNPLSFTLQSRIFLQVRNAGHPAK
jgi:hypothetical protein